jgi:2-polyprenyl-3-methyl-5-hydroxy-6-metoxy-1,4-benzoquinol methylase
MKSKASEFWKSFSKSVGVGKFSKANLEQDEALAEFKFNHESNLIFTTFDLKEKKRVLDLAAGTGLWSKKFSLTAKKVTHLERERVLIEIAKANNSNENVEYVCSDVRDFEFKKCTEYDLIFISGLLLYLSDKEVSEMLQNLKEVMGDNSQIIVRDALSISKTRYIVDRWSSELRTHYYATYRTSEEFKSIFSKLGYSMNEPLPLYKDGSKFNKRKETRLFTFSITTK